MGQTPISSSTPYITVAEFLQRKDVNAVGMLVRDDGTVATPGELESDPNLAAILFEASGQVEAACLASERYSVEDLQADNGASKAYLKGLIADIAFYRLFGRRDAPMPPEYVTAQYEGALTAIQQLSNGDRILAFAQTAAAGVPSDSFMTRSDIINLNTLTFGCRRSLGIRQNMRRPF